ncbi:NAD(P)-binding protein [Mytilinidion resinicola]|uniref:NAD(P)-binding protein n=1 Tax=Mytilinidion resinicola TaxID=574789 RepID=A0A6A6YI98_9PEZI|nr:NAD(P)-binding protein [Mytilinidion resinicola]KAF2807714.1 NAD(P)-binding protein [Mytilinidion resinicola]
MASLKSALACIGLLYSVKISYHLVDLLWVYFIRPTSISRYLSTDPSHPSWALVTGSTDGIGLGFSHELCSRGFNVLLHGRNPEKLARVQADLLQKFPGRSIETVVADAAAYDAAGLRSVVEKASSLPDGGRLRVLVNNVGGAFQLIGKGVFGLLSEMTVEDVDTFINVNARFPAVLTTALVPVLTAESNAPTLVMNIGSMANYGLPYSVVYSATKSFNLTFSAAFGREMKSRGHDVEVLGFVVGTTDTVGAPAEKQGNMAVMTPRGLAKACLDRSGCGRWILPPSFKHWIPMKINESVPESLIVNQVEKLWTEDRKGN